MMQYYLRRKRDWEGLEHSLSFSIDVKSNGAFICQEAHLLRSIPAKVQYAEILTQLFISMGCFMTPGINC